MTAAALHSASACIHHVFEARAAAAPDAIALTFADQRLSYRELNERSNRLAHHLRRLGAGPDIFVGLCLERSLDLVVALLGILKAGATYVPIDPQYPRDRIAFMLQDSQAPIVVTQQALAKDLPMATGHVVLLDGDSPAISHEHATNPDSGVTSNDLAYVIYTSGSTGRPKGTLISHHNVMRLFTSTQHWFGFSAADVWTLFHSCAFDFSVWEMWGALLHGGRLVVVPFAVSRTPDAFYRLLCDEKVTVLNQTPSAFRQLIHADENSRARDELALRLVIFGGEALDFTSLKPWFARHGDERPRLVNMYGITETTVHVTYRPIRSGDVSGASVIGEPIPDLELHLKDDTGLAVPTGTVGEIYVGGAGVSRGYLNRPELTAQKFLVDPMDPAKGKRLYRSGDLGRYLPNGDLEYLGRIDQQVKIRGFRIELGEIAAAIGEHPGVRESVVLIRESASGDKRLAAYVVAVTGATVTSAALRQILRERLPEYMVPAVFFFLEKLPLTVNGKLDTQALSALAETPTPPARGFAVRGSELEQAIAAIWREELKVKIVELDDNFFDIGGNSLHLAVIHTRLQAFMERDFQITELFAHSTVRALAAHFSSSGKAAPAVNPATLRANLQRAALSAQRNNRRETK